jgi:sulfate adenylyltransferase
METLISPYGGRLNELMVGAERAADLRREALELASIDLDWSQMCWLELLLGGALSPLAGYMGKAELDSVLSGMALPDGLVWPQPVMLAVGEKIARGLQPGQSVALRDGEGYMPAILHVSEIWAADPDHEMRVAEAAGVALSQPLARIGQYYVAGRVEGIAPPPRYDFPMLRLTPRQVREQFALRGWRRVLAYQPAQPMHRPQFEFVLRAAVEHEANLLVHAVAGSDPVMDAGHFTLVRACQALMPRFPAATSLFALTPMAPLSSGPREALLRAVIARNHGCSHLVVGGEMAVNGRLHGEHRRGEDLTYLGQEGSFAQALRALGVKLVAFPRMVYVEDRDEYLPEHEVPEGARRQSMHGQELARRLMQNLKVPEWFTYPEVIEELRRSYPPRNRQGFTVFFTGLSGAGKSTIARALTVKLMEIGHRRVSLLDGDIVRRHLSSELGFSREHRDINIRRIGFVASEITKHGGIAVCAPIAPYRQTRRDVRAMIEPWGGFIEIHVSTSIEVCEARDRKGLYAKARAGLIPEFTGVSDPYETPERPELAIDTDKYSVEEAVQMIVLKLEHEGFLR